jgi:hypothetical protein
MEGENIVHERLSEMMQGQVISKPSLMWDLLYLFPDLSNGSKINLLQQLLLIARSLLHNPCILVNSSTMTLPDNQKIHVLNKLIELSIKEPPEVHDKILEFIGFLVSTVGVRRTNTYSLYQTLMAEKPSSSMIEASIQVLSVLLSNTRQPPPYNYFFFSGPGSGLALEGSALPEYPFTKAFSFCMWIRLEDISTQPLPRLFTFHSEGNGGIEAYFVKSRLYYRILPPNYTAPVEGSNGVLINDFPPEQWIYFAFEHERTNFGRHQLKVVIDGEEILNIPMDFPRFKTKNPELTQAGLCLDMSGQLSCAMFFNEIITVQK